MTLLLLWRVPISVSITAMVIWHFGNVAHVSSSSSATEEAKNRIARSAPELAPAPAPAPLAKGEGGMGKRDDDEEEEEDGEDDDDDDRKDLPYDRKKPIFQLSHSNFRAEKVKKEMEQNKDYSTGSKIIPSEEVGLDNDVSDGEEVVNNNKISDKSKKDKHIVLNDSASDEESIYIDGDPENDTPDNGAGIMDNQRKDSAVNPNRMANRQAAHKSAAVSTLPPVANGDGGGSGQGSPKQCCAKPWRKTAQGCYLLDHNFCKKRAGSENKRGCNWHQARSVCQEQGGYLAEILDQTEHQQLAQHILNRPEFQQPYWIGLHLNEEVGFSYRDRKTLGKFSGWCQGSPRSPKENKCVLYKVRRLKGKGGKGKQGKGAVRRCWHNESCHLLRSPLCEKDLVECKNSREDFDREQLQEKRDSKGNPRHFDEMLFGGDEPARQEEHRSGKYPAKGASKNAKNSKNPVFEYFDVADNAVGKGGKGPHRQMPPKNVGKGKHSEITVNINHPGDWTDDENEESGMKQNEKEDEESGKSKEKEKEADDEKKDKQKDDKKKKSTEKDSGDKKKKEKGDIGKDDDKESSGESEEDDEETGKEEEKEDKKRDDGKKEKEKEEEDEEKSDTESTTKPSSEQEKKKKKIKKKCQKKCEKKEGKEKKEKKPKKKKKKEKEPKKKSSKDKEKDDPVQKDKPTLKEKIRKPCKKGCKGVKLPKGSKLSQVKKVLIEEKQHVVEKIEKKIEKIKGEIEDEAAGIEKASTPLDEKKEKEDDNEKDQGSEKPPEKKASNERTLMGKNRADLESKSIRDFKCQEDLAKLADCFLCTLEQEGNKKDPCGCHKSVKEITEHFPRGKTLKTRPAKEAKGSVNFGNNQRAAENRATDVPPPLHRLHGATKANEKQAHDNAGQSEDGRVSEESPEELEANNDTEEEASTEEDAGEDQDLQSTEETGIHRAEANLGTVQNGNAVITAAIKDDKVARLGLGDKGERHGGVTARPKLSPKKHRQAVSTSVGKGNGSKPKGKGLGPTNNTCVGSNGQHYPQGPYWVRCNSGVCSCEQGGHGCKLHGISTKKCQKGCYRGGQFYSHGQEYLGSCVKCKCVCPFQQGHEQIPCQFETATCQQVTKGSPGESGNGSRNGNGKEKEWKCQDELAAVNRDNL